jgi:glutaconate CoA-transferase subunit B
MTDLPLSNNGAYTFTEIMVVAAARALAGVRTVFVGVGSPNLACNLARLTVAPSLELIYESGVYGAQPARQPLSIGDPTLVTGAISVISMADLFGLYLQGGLVEVALLGGAQIDRYGNLNTTVIGSYTDPKVRLPGSGGACEIAINAQRVYIIMQLKKRAFVEKLDFLTSPGHLHGSTSGQKPGIPGKGPQLVITDKALFDFANAEQEMQLVSLYPGVTLEAITEEMGWKVKVASTLIETHGPTSEELAIMRRLSSGGTSQRAGEA